MAFNSNQLSHNEEEIDLREIFNILIKSKKLIISTILLFSIASIIYSLSLKPSFKSSVSIEIGFLDNRYDNRMGNLIETASNLASELKIKLFKKNLNDNFNQRVTISEFEGKIISLQTTSDSVETNENLLTELVNFIHERHSKIRAQKKDLLISEISLIKAEKDFLESILLNKDQPDYLTQIQISHQYDRLFSINQTIINLNKKIEAINITGNSKTKIINNLTHITLKPKTRLTIILGIIFGFFTSIFLALSIHFINNYRVSKA